MAARMAGNRKCRSAARTSIDDALNDDSGNNSASLLAAMTSGSTTERPGWRGSGWQSGWATHSAINSCAATSRWPAILLAACQDSNAAWAAREIADSEPAPEPGAAGPVMVSSSLLPDIAPHLRPDLR